MSSFDAAWLLQREAYDLAARSKVLEKKFLHAIYRQRNNPNMPLRLLDLGGGTAANVRALAPHIQGNQNWLICDYDAELLSTIQSSISEWSFAHGWEYQWTNDSMTIDTGSAQWRLQTCLINLAIDLEAIDLAYFDGVTTTAFLDLVSKPWLERFAQWIGNASLPLLATLTVDGRRQWQPELPADAQINTAFEEHQLGDKGFGPSLGPSAAQSLQRIFQGRNIDCETQRSDWRIPSSDFMMLSKMANESALIAGEINPSKEEVISVWLHERRGLIEQKQSSLLIGHLDLLAIPK